MLFQTFIDVELFLFLENEVNVKLVQFFICVIDEELLESILIKYFKSVDVE